MSTAEEDQWSNDDIALLNSAAPSPRVPLGWEGREETRRLANQAVHDAILAYHRQPWYATAWARCRFGLFWVTYWLRLQLAMFLVLKLGWDDRRVWNKLYL